MWKLYLDDTRTPPSDEWTLARDMEEAICLIADLGAPSVVSFDHDLGVNRRGIKPSGLEFAKWLCEQDMCGQVVFPDDFKFFVHSANPQGAANIRSYMLSYLKVRDEVRLK